MKHDLKLKHDLPITLRLDADRAGQTAEAALAAALPGASESFVAKLLRQGRVLLDGRALEAGARLPASGTLEVLEPLPGLGPRPPAPNPAVPFAVRHADEHLVVLEKPWGVTMHPGPGHGSDTLLNGLVARHPELLQLGAERGFGLVHRLDRETSGLVVVARTAEAYDGLTAAFAAREVDKRYRALVKGAPRDGARAGRIEAPIDGREAATTWELVERVGHRKWVVCVLTAHPLTGRKHQLRIHLASIGCPILGDKRHGAPTIPLAQQIGLKRVALHAEALAFAHPVTGARLAFEAPWPRELEAAWGFAKQVAPTAPGPPGA